ncbi:RCC1 and BTB domain-containing protein 2-like [Oppia nitens]|uniref:RCC1 and BTB domain-containing protein 2-like n=1 Tax=Oppia nitens TaxID=1686743 RepID=UPI0023DA27FF|nr:RCC1 and BTB domain-containing protein 2-like [Oppia nitens]
MNRFVVLVAVVIIALPTNNWIKRIERFYVFDDKLGVNMLFVTKDDDRVYGLGANLCGSLGLGHNQWVSEPQEIIELRHKKCINFINGEEFIVCVSSDNCLYSWGYNRFGQLGYRSDDKEYNKPMIIQINENNDLICDVSCGSYHTLVVTENNNEVYGWGRNDFGQIGSQNTDSDAIIRPEKIVFDVNYCIKSVHCFEQSSFALTMDGQVFSWGQNCNNILGHNNNNNNDRICLPQLISNLFELKMKTPNDWIKIIDRFYVFDDKLGVNMLFVTKDDRVYGLGANYWGSLGLGHNQWMSEPKEIIGLRHKKIVNFINGSEFMIFVSSDNSLYICGFNRWGQLCQGNEDFETKKPMIIQINENNDLIRDVSCGSFHTLVVTENNNEVYGWGNNTIGQIGSRDTTCDAITKPEKIEFNDNYCIKSVHCFDCSSFALTSDGQVFSWGYNSRNQLGLNSSDLIIFRPQLICNLNGITSIQSGFGETYFSSSYKNENIFLFNE